MSVEAPQIGRAVGAAAAMAAGAAEILVGAYTAMKGAAIGMVSGDNSEVAAGLLGIYAGVYTYASGGLGLSRALMTPCAPRCSRDDQVADGIQEFFNDDMTWLSTPLGKLVSA